MGRPSIARAAVAALASLLLPAGPLHGGQRDPKAPTTQTLECLRGYRAAIEDYRAKRTDAAIATVTALDQAQQKLILQWVELVHSSQPRPSRATDSLFAWDRQTLLAAGMLQADVALAAKGPADVTFHGLVAADLLVLASKAGVDAPGSGERRAVLAIGLLLIAGHSIQADTFLKNATVQYPSDAPLLTGLGMVYENEAAALTQPPATIDLRALGNRRGLRDDVLRDAGALFERAISADPAVVEARVRLARVKTLQHDDNRAAALLDQVLAAQPPPRWRYMALLLLGGVRERAGRTDEALRLYGQAIDTRPDGQSAYLAMSQASYGAGDRASASQILDRLFARALKPSADEPWWNYQDGDWIEGQEMLGALRAEAQR